MRACINPDDDRGKDDRGNSYGQEEQTDQSDEAICIAVTVICVILHVPNKLWDEDGVQGPADHQDVDHIRQRVAEVEHIGHGASAKGCSQNNPAHHPTHARQNRAGPHDDTGLQGTVSASRGSG